MDISKTLTDIAAKLLDLGEAHASEDLGFCRDQIEAEKAHLRAEIATLKGNLEMYDTELLKGEGSER